MKHPPFCNSNFKRLMEKEAIFVAFGSTTGGNMVHFLLNVIIWLNNVLKEKNTFTTFVDSPTLISYVDPGEESEPPKEPRGSCDGVFLLLLWNCASKEALPVSPSAPVSFLVLWSVRSVLLLMLTKEFGLFP